MPTALPSLLRPTLMGAAVGILLSIVDVWALVAVGVDMQVAGGDATGIVLLVFALTYSALGAAVGGLIGARRRLRLEARALRQANSELEAARAALVRAETLAALGRMAAGVAHEVRNPLAVMRSSAGLISEDLPAGGEAAEACGFIVAEVDRLDAFVRRVLDLGRQVRPETRQLDLAELARQVAVREGVEAEATSAPTRADPDLLTGSLLELVGNARAVGAARVQLRAGHDPDGAWLEVADDGPGLGEVAEEQLFTPFFTTRAEGTGLGLAVAQRVAQAQGATLAYRPGAGLGPGGAGACFRLSFPVAS